MPAPQHLKNLCVISFTGNDTLSFLQGQLSNDINALEDNWQFSGYCNPKGRLLALLQLWKVADIVYAVLDKSLVEAIVKRLRMYVMRSQVVINELSDVQCFGLVDLGLSDTRFSLEVTDRTHRLNFGSQQLIIEFSDAEVNSGSNDKEWVAANILNGLPSISSATYELFVPQMVNLDLIGGINFKKGCYTGQEIVARMHYLGKLKQRMFVCDIDGEANAGDKVLSKSGSEDHAKTAGNLVSVAPKSKLALAVLRTEMVEAKQNFALDNGVGLTVRDSQPYELTQTGSN